MPTVSRTCHTTVILQLYGSASFCYNQGRDNSPSPIERYCEAGQSHPGRNHVRTSAPPNRRSSLAENDYIKLKCPQCGADLPAGTDEIECAYCGTRLTLRRRSQTQSTGVGERTRDTQSVGHICQDSNTGLPALRLEVPKDWRVSGGVTWVPNRPGAPVQIALRGDGPDGVTAFEIFPAQYFVWMSNAPMGPMPGPTPGM